MREITGANGQPTVILLLDEKLAEKLIEFVVQMLLQVFLCWAVFFWVFLDLLKIAKEFIIYLWSLGFLRPDLTHCPIFYPETEKGSENLSACSCENMFQSRSES